MAADGERWERGRAVIWETTGPVYEWLVDRLAPQPGQTILELAAGAGETGFLAAGRLGDHGRLISSDFASPRGCRPRPDSIADVRALFGRGRA